jgi:PPM family protein phosphatase
MNGYKGTFAFKKDVGRVRLSNEDQCGVALNSYGDVFLCVCDGMGGQNKGDYASKMALDSLMEDFRSMKKIPSFFLKTWLSRAYKKANALIYSEAGKSPLYNDMGTTCVTALIRGNHLIVGNVGDSRAYRYSRDTLRLTRLSEDQTYVDYLYRTGRISEKEMSSRPDRHVLMNAMGISRGAYFDIHSYPYNGETILLCSDGLYNNLSEAEIKAVLSTSDTSDEKASYLIAEANGNGGSDNIAVALWEVLKHD